MKSRRKVVLGAMLVALAVLVLVSGCGTPALQNEMGYQGRLTDAAGNPINGTKNMTFRLYTAETGGTAIWEETHAGVQVSDGLFNVVLGESTPLDEAQFHQPLYLEVVVDGETLSPRQKLLGAPYAFSLVPGAVIKGYIAATETYSSTLNVANFSDGQAIGAISATGHGIYVQSGGGAYAGAALLAENTNTTNGIAIWADNESSDTTLVVRNKGSGPLIKGFGGDGGGHEFIVTNAGDVWYEGALLGAFPRPAYDSGWVAIAPGEAKTLTHNLGGNTDNYVVDLQFRGGTSALFADPHIREIGGQQRSDGKWHGAYWRSLTPTTITVFRQYDSTDQFFTEFRLRIWVYK